MSRTRDQFVAASPAGLSQGPRPLRLVRGRRRRWVVSLGLLCFVLPHLYVVAMGVEDFPLTCAGMFAQQITPQTPRYAFQLTGDDGVGGQPRLMPFSDIGASKRSFFVHAYGSASPNTCHTYFYNDTPEAFSARMSDWLTGFMNTWKRMHPDRDAPQRLTLWLEQIYPQRGQPIPVLHYRAKDKAVELRPEVQWPRELLEQNDKAEEGA